MIYNYEKEKMHLQDEAMELLMQDQGVLNEIYQRVDFNDLRKSVAD